MLFSQVRFWYTDLFSRMSFYLIIVDQKAEYFRNSISKFDWQTSDLNYQNFTAVFSGTLSVALNLNLKERKHQFFIKRWSPALVFSRKQLWVFSSFFIKYHWSAVPTVIQMKNVYIIIQVVHRFFKTLATVRTIINDIQQKFKLKRKETSIFY